MQNRRLIISIFALLFVCLAASAQENLRTFTYFSYDYDSDHTDTSKVFVTSLNSQLLIKNDKTPKNPIPGYVDDITYVDYLSDSIFYCYPYKDSTFYVASTMNRNDIKWDTQIVDSKTTRYVTSINSNRIELLFSTKEGYNVNPLPYYGKFDGVLKQMVRNGLVQIEFSSMDKSKNGIIYHNYMLFKELINVHRIFGVTGTNGTKSFVNPIKNPPSFT